MSPSSTASRRTCRACSGPNLVPDHVGGGLSDQEAIAYKFNPVDNLAPLAAARIPLLLVYGDSDRVVPHPENSASVSTAIRPSAAPSNASSSPAKTTTPTASRMSHLSLPSSTEPSRAPEFK